MHRVHKAGDSRCREQQFECPSCDERFPRPIELQTHIESSHTQEASLTLLSVNSTSDWMFVSCSKCGEKLSNEADLKLHTGTKHGPERNVIELSCKACGETFGNDINLADYEVAHEQARNQEDLFEDTFEMYGIEILLGVTKRRKQNFDDLNIDENGDIEVDNNDENDASFEVNDLQRLLVVDPVLGGKKARKSKRKPTSVVGNVRKKSKATDNNKGINVNECRICKTTFTRPDNL